LWNRSGFATTAINGMIEATPAISRKADNRIHEKRASIRRRSFKVRSEKIFLIISGKAKVLFYGLVEFK